MNKASSKYTLPGGWELADLGSLALFVNGKAFMASDWKGAGIPIIRIQNLNNKDAGFNYISECQTVEDKYIVEPGDLLFTWSGSFGAYIWNGQQAYLNQHIYKVICFSGMTNKFFFYLLNQQLQKFTEKSRGTGLIHITKRELQSTKCLIPPLREQNRIVDKLEELLSELDHSTSTLIHAQKQLEVYYQALLKNAFDGTLTSDWRESNKSTGTGEILNEIKKDRQNWNTRQLQEWEKQLDKWNADGKHGKRPIKPRIRETVAQLDETTLSNLPELPNEWSWITLDSFAAITSGVTKGKRYYNQDTVQLPYLRVANVQDGFLDLTEVKTIGVPPYELDKYKLEYGDVLYTEGGDKDKVGRGAMWRNEIPNCIHQNHVFRARIVSDIVNSVYCSMFSRTRIAKNYFFKNAKQTTNLASINLGVLSGMPFPLPSIAEQEAIVELLDSKFSIIENLEKSVQESLTQTEALRQSILKKAFEGTLVEQNSKDEPASELLKRIKAEKMEYLNNQKALRQKQPKRTKKMSKTQNIKDVLQSSDEPIRARDVWQQSEHKGDIEKFYSELKAIKASIKQVKEGTQSLLSLRS